MDPLHLSQHISRQFNSEIEDVRRQVLAMGGLVEEQIAAALGMLLDRDAARGTEIREREREVNAAELAIDERCAYILARRQPAACPELGRPRSARAPPRRVSGFSGGDRRS